MRPAGQKTWVEVSRSAIIHNLEEVKRIVHPARVLCVLKSNAYGHGLSEVAQICHQYAEWFGVDSLEEANVLRRNKIQKPVLIMGYICPEQIEEVIKKEISFVAYTLPTLNLAIRLAKKVGIKAKIHLKLETGLTRQGTEGEDFKKIIMTMKRSLAWVELEGIATHFANVEDSQYSGYTRSQLSRFNHGMSCLDQNGLRPQWRHTAASAAALLYPESRMELIRLGISLYGYWPSEKTQEAFSKKMIPCILRPALTWKTIIVQVKDVSQGTPVSYGLTEKVSRASRVAVLPIGYWDGYDRVGMSRKAEVLVQGQRCKVLGRVCMNMCMVDVTDVPTAKAGEEVVLIGMQKEEKISVEELAIHANTINYEILTRINPLIHRIIVR